MKMSIVWVAVLLLGGCQQRRQEQAAPADERVDVSARAVAMRADGRDLVVSTSKIEDSHGNDLRGVQFVRVVFGRGKIIYDSQVIDVMPAEQRFSHAGDGFYTVEVMNAAMSEGRAESFITMGYFQVKGAEVMAVDESQSPNNIGFTDEELESLARENAAFEGGGK